MIEELIIGAYGIANITLLAGIFYRLGKVETRLGFVEPLIESHGVRLEELERRAFDRHFGRRTAAAGTSG